MPRFAHPVHAMTDAEQARGRRLSMTCLLRWADDTDWPQEHRFVLWLKAGAATPRRTVTPVGPRWRPEDAA